ncbi:hypothetical protein EDB84DRAFT_1271088 [Lactarius hengduanensis]|nr:hypothetical protein EDB84DRAFT_1271088 [Lactarius hengduanensis]
MVNRTNPELANVLQCLSDNGYTIFSLVTSVLSWCNLDQDLDDLGVQLAREDLERDAVDVCARLLSHTTTSVSVSTWALQVTQSTLRSEVEEMTKKRNGLHFSASTATAEQIELAFMPQLAGKMRILAPSLWGLVFTLLGALDERRSSVMVDPNSVNLSELFHVSEQLLGDLGEDEAAEENSEAVGDENNPDVQREDERRPRKRSRKDVSARNTALRVIVRHYCISIN